MTAQAGGASPSSSSIATLLTERAALRTELRSRRRAVSSASRRQAAVQIAQHLQRTWLLHPGRRIGIYLATPAELPLDEVLSLLRRRGCRVFVPHITQRRGSRMVFRAFNAESRLVKDHWQIPHLHHSHAVGAPVDALQLDVVLVPMLGFDAQGHRLGMGGGYYDRYFARLRGTRRWRKPRLVGTAYDCQRVETLPTQPHDVAMDFILTESGLHRPQRHA